MGHWSHAPAQAGLLHSTMRDGLVVESVCIATCLLHPGAHLLQRGESLWLGTVKLTQSGRQAKHQPSGQRVGTRLQGLQWLQGQLGQLGQLRQRGQWCQSVIEIVVAATAAAEAAAEAVKAAHVAHVAHMAHVWCHMAQAALSRWSVGRHALTSVSLSIVDGDGTDGREDPSVTDGFESSEGSEGSNLEFQTERR